MKRLYVGVSSVYVCELGELEQRRLRVGERIKSR